MRNASRGLQLATPVAAQQESQDHIITISTASLTEHAQEAPIKQATLPTITTTTATAAAAATSATVPTTAATTAAGGAAASTNPVQVKAPLCRLSQFVSYQNNIADVQHRRGRRLHGLQLPLHPLQLFGWLVLLLFGLASYLVLIPAFHAPIQGPLYGLISGLYVVHIAAHLTALLTDPADKELRRVHRNDRIVPEFDRSKHGHVIENGRCHLCNIRTSTPRTKHCSVCNKCVGKFDHHCKWLNHCIGSRNYVAFLMCVVSAVVATLVIVAAVIGQIVLYYVQPDWLSFYWCNSRLDSSLESTDYINLTLSLSNGTIMLLEQAQDVEEQPNELDLDAQQQLLANLSTLPTLLENITTALLEEQSTSTIAPQTNHTVNPLVAGIGVHETIYLLLLGVLGLLAAISAGLLLHLCFFHIYISFLGLTTYEYIRNHRQAQEAKAKQLLEQGKNNGVHFNPNMPTVHNHPSKLAAAQLYCCSSVPHPNQPAASGSDSPRAAHRLHCCASSREFHQTRQAVYVCSLLQERHSEHVLETANAPDADATGGSVRAFHCCSSFAASAMQRRVSAAASAKTALETRQTRAHRSAGAGGYMQYTEQCTLCTFQLRSPARGGSHSSSGSAPGSSSTRTLASQTVTPSSSAAGNISKHQRWRRKWNCCVSVPDSPDVPNDLLAALSYREHAKINATELPVQFIRSLNGGLDVPHHHSTAELPLKTPRSSRLRHMLRLLGRYRRARCHRGTHANHGVAAAEQQVAAIKQNQIRPLQLQAGGGGAGAGAGGRLAYNDNASSTTTPMPLSSPSHSCSSSGASSSELSMDHCIGNNHGNGNGNGNNNDLMLLPTSVIRDDSVTTSYTLTLPPALPPPTRRKMPNASELAELAETLGFVTSQSSQTNHHHHQSSSNCASRQLPGLGNVYRRQRRKHFLRTRSPTLSPIHESGLSNPTSPQPLRHSLANSSNSIASSNAAKCSPDVARTSAALVQNLCGLAGEALRKTASNSSLQSISSNSSST